MLEALGRQLFRLLNLPQSCYCLGKRIRYTSPRSKAFLLCSPPTISPLLTRLHLQVLPPCIELLQNLPLSIFFYPPHTRVTTSTGGKILDLPIHYHNSHLSTSRLQIAGFELLLRTRWRLPTKIDNTTHTQMVEEMLHILPRELL